MASYKPKRLAEKLFVIRKYVKAVSAVEAIKKERKEPVHEVFIDDEWRKNNTDRLGDAMGFKVPNGDS